MLSQSATHVLETEADRAADGGCERRPRCGTWHPAAASRATTAPQRLAAALAIPPVVFLLPLARRPIARIDGPLGAVDTGHPVVPGRRSGADRSVREAPSANRWARIGLTAVQALGRIRLGQAQASARLPLNLGLLLAGAPPPLTFLLG
jgi:hypothetical protein